MASFLEATKGAALAAERLRVVVKGAHQFTIVGVGVACGTQPIMVVDESELQALGSIQSSLS